MILFVGSIALRRVRGGRRHDLRTVAECLPMDCGSLLPLSSASLLAPLCQALLLNHAQSQSPAAGCEHESGSRLPQSRDH